MPCWLSAELTIFWNNVQGLGGDTSIGVDLFCDIVDVNVIGFTYCSLIEIEDPDHMIGAAI